MTEQHRIKHRCSCGLAVTGNAALGTHRAACGGYWKCVSHNHRDKVIATIYESELAAIDAMLSTIDVPESDDDGYLRLTRHRVRWLIDKFLDVGARG